MSQPDQQHKLLPQPGPWCGREPERRPVLPSGAGARIVLPSGAPRRPLSSGAEARAAAPSARAQPGNVGFGLRRRARSVPLPRRAPDVPADTPAPSGDARSPEPERDGQAAPLAPRLLCFPGNHRDPLKRPARGSHHVTARRPRRHLTSGAPRPLSARGLAAPGRRSPPAAPRRTLGSARRSRLCRKDGGGTAAPRRALAGG